MRGACNDLGVIAILAPSCARWIRTRRTKTNHVAVKFAAAIELKRVLLVAAIDGKPRKLVIHVHVNEFHVSIWLVGADAIRDVVGWIFATKSQRSSGCAVYPHRDGEGA